MKKILILVLVLLVGYAGQSQTSIKDYKYKYNFSLSPFSFANSSLDVNLERMLASNKSLVLRGAVKYRDPGQDLEVGVLGELQYRYYLMHNGHKSTNHPFNIALYAAPYVYVKQLYDESPEFYVNVIYHDQFYPYQPVNSDITYNSVGFGIYSGVKGVIFERLTIDLFLGGGLDLTYFDTDNNMDNVTFDIFEEGYSGIIPRGNLSIGFLF